MQLLHEGGQESGIPGLSELGGRITGIFGLDGDDEAGWGYLVPGDDGEGDKGPLVEWFAYCPF